MIIDIIAAIVVLISTFIAFIRGFIREVLTIAGVLGALAAAYYGGPMLDPVMQGWIGMDPDEPQRLFDVVPYEILSKVLSYGLIFVVVLIVLSVISHFVAETVKAVGLGAVDRTLGVIFGIARGVLLLGLLYLPIHLTHKEEAQQEKVERWFDGSQSHFYMEVTADWLAQFLPDTTKMEIEKSVKDGAENVQKNNDARKALEQMDLLRRDGEAPADAQPKDGQGYNENFREEMDQLFQEEIAPEPEPGEGQQEQSR